MDPRVVCYVLIFQFPVRSSERVPKEVNALGPPPPPKGIHAPRESRGNRIVNCEPDCSYATLVEKLRKAGFRITRASKEEGFRRRTDDKPEPVINVRFDLHRAEGNIEGEEDFNAALQACIVIAGWMTTVWNNQYCNGEEEFPDQRALSVNAIGPQWLLEVGGQPVMVWPSTKVKKEKGDKVPRQPARTLDLTENGMIKVT